MSVSPGEESSARVGRLGRALIVLGVLFFVGAGLLFWWRHGDAVFASYVSAAIAWCF